MFDLTPDGIFTLYLYNKHMPTLRTNIHNNYNANRFGMPILSPILSHRSIAQFYDDLLFTSIGLTIFTRILYTVTNAINVFHTRL